MMKWHPYMRFHQSAELSIFSWLLAEYDIIQRRLKNRRPRCTIHILLAGNATIAGRMLHCHAWTPNFLVGRSPTDATKKPSPTANPNRTPPLSPPLFPTHQDHALYHQSTRPSHHPKPACGWKSTFIGFLFQSTMPPCDTAITALRTSLPRKTWRHNLRSSTGQVLLWHYGSTMVFYVGCQGKHRLKKRERSKPFWRWKIQMCLYPKSCRTFATPRKGLI